MKNRKKIKTFSLCELNVLSELFPFVKIFFRIQISLQLIKQTLIWNATVYFFIWNAGDFFQTELTDTVFDPFLQQQPKRSFPFTKHVK